MHIALPLLLFEIPYIKKNYKTNRFALIIGSLISDFFDKPLEILGLSSGKGIFHTVLFAFIAFLVVYVVTKGNLSISIPILIGILMHLPLDEPQVPYFWPFFSLEFVEISENPIAVWLSRASLTYLFIIITEIVGGIILLFIIVHNKLYSFSKLIDYLKTNPIIQDNKDESLKDKERVNRNKSIILFTLYFTFFILFIIILINYDSIG